MIKIEDIKKMNLNEIKTKIVELKKSVFDNKQKLLKGELQNTSLISKEKKIIARLNMIFTQKQQEKSQEQVKNEK